MFEKKPRIIDLETIEDISKPVKTIRKPIVLKTSPNKISIIKKIDIARSKIEKKEHKVEINNKTDSGDDILWL